MQQCAVDVHNQLPYVLPRGYVYMVCAVRPTNIVNGLAKMDVATGEVQTWHEPGGIVGEWWLTQQVIHGHHTVNLWMHRLWEESIAAMRAAGGC